MNRYEERIATNIAKAREQIKTALEDAGQWVREGIRDEVLVVDNSAEYQLDIVLKKSDWRTGYADGVQLTIKAPSSKRGSYSWHVDQVRNFRTGKDGTTLNLDGIVAAVKKLSGDMIASDEARAAKQKRDAEERDAREESRAALAAAGLLPQPRGETELDRECNKKYSEQHGLGDDNVARVAVNHSGEVSIRVEGLTPAQAIALLGRL